MIANYIFHIIYVTTVNFDIIKIEDLVIFMIFTNMFIQ